MEPCVQHQTGFTSQYGESLGDIKDIPIEDLVKNIEDLQDMEEV